MKGEVIVPCPTCGKPALSETYIRTRDGVTTRVHRIKCGSYRRKKRALWEGKGPKHPVSGCPLHEEEEPIDVPVLDKGTRRALAQKIEQKGLTHIEVSERAGLNPKTLSKVIAGQCISDEALARVHEVLDGESGEDPSNAPCMAKDLRNLHPSNQDKILDVAAERALPDYNPPATQNLSELTGTGPAPEDLLARLEVRLAALEEMTQRCLHQLLEQTQEQFHDLREAGETRELDSLPDEPDIYDQFRSFETACRNALQRDSHLFRASVARVWAEVVEKAGQP